MVEVNHTAQFEQLLFTYTNWRPQANVHILSGETPTAHELVPILLEKISDNLNPKNNNVIHQEVWY